MPKKDETPLEFIGGLDFIPELFAKTFPDKKLDEESKELLKYLVGTFKVLNTMGVVSRKWAMACSNLGMRMMAEELTRDHVWYRRKVH